MEKESIPNESRRNVTKEVFKDLIGAKEKKERRGVSGRESPESGSLYSDYESGQQYEQDLPSGYNSGEQYDTLSTGYMSGEAYELPEARPEPLEPTLAAIEEVSMRSAEDLFTIQMPESNLLAQVDRMESSSSGSIQDTLECTAPESALHKGKRKKNVTYCVSVPMEKSPLGQDIRGYRDLPSDTDTTSCFDSDGTYMRSDLQSSDSGAALIHHSTRRKRKDLKEGTEGIIRGNGKRMRRKAKRVIRNHEEFFLIYDNKHWEMARQICFWFSVLAIIGSIVTAAIMIAFIPHTCDPAVSWWQGSVLLEVRPTNDSLGNPVVDLRSLIDDIPFLHSLGFKGIKLVNFYLKQQDNPTTRDFNSFFYANDFDALRSRLGDLNLLTDLASSLHAANMTLLVDIPTLSANSTVEPEIDFKITKAIQFWAGLGVNGISLVGLESYGADRFVSDRVAAWATDFEKYSKQTQRILITSYLLPESIDGSDGADRSVGKAGSDSIGDFGLLEATLDLSNLTNLQENILAANKWDKTPAQPWILWHQAAPGFQPASGPAAGVQPASGPAAGVQPLNPAQLAFQMFLPGTIALPPSVIEQIDNKTNVNATMDGNGTMSVLAQLISARTKIVPLYMNGNYKICHGSCDGDQREDNFKITTFDDDSLLVMERHYNRRNRIMLIANFGSDEPADLKSVGKMFSSGEVVVDTTGALRVGSDVTFNSLPGIPAQHALVIKLPK